MPDQIDLSSFTSTDLFTAAEQLFLQLGIKLNSNTRDAIDVAPLLGSEKLKSGKLPQIQRAYFLGLIDNSVFGQTDLFNQNGYSLKEAEAVASKSYDGLMMLGLQLPTAPTRTDISKLTRAFNRASLQMPVGLLLSYPLHHHTYITLSFSERFTYQQHWRQGEKTGKVIMLKDINTSEPHSGHQRILLDLVKTRSITTYKELHKQWLLVLDTNVLNKQFFTELANWYFWAQTQVWWPNDAKEPEEKHIQISLIRLITRLIFVWFLKEKGLINNKLFDLPTLQKLLKQFYPADNSKTSGWYYKAILQNLFFGTLNQRMKDREFAAEGDLNTNKAHYSVRTLYRYAEAFSISKADVKKLFADIPFLNGGLFDCLDPTDEDTNKTYYADGFTRNARKQAKVPDHLFFGEETTVDLSDFYDDKRRKNQKVHGLLHILNRYKFTIEENTPLEEEIALDPELLGKVFENLLAYYNPETGATARKATGSFYTPREIVNYMVDESLVETLAPKLTSHISEKQAKETLHQLLNNGLAEQPLEQKQTKLLLSAIDDLKILDPACGSGAYPMGILNRLVTLLQKVDPENEHWRKLQQQKAETEIHDALTEKDRKLREEKLIEINDAFEHNSSDYGRKLYLIENCIYGIDIQPIAVQISKLRFFISLIVDQKERPGVDNRGIRPLPNLETKFVAANSLLGLQKPEGLNFRNQKILELEAELKDNRHNHFSADSWSKKKNCQKKDKSLRRKIADELRKEYQLFADGVSKKIQQHEHLLQQALQAKVIPANKAKHTKAVAELQARIARWQQTIGEEATVDETANAIANFDLYNQNASAAWFDAEWMYGLTPVEGTGPFDIVIGNPPYVQIQKLEPAFKAQLEKQGYKTYTRTGDLYQLFYEKGIDLLRPNGILAYITSNKWMRTDYGETTRNYFSHYVQPLMLIDFGMQLVFESAATLTNILLLQKRPAEATLRLCRIGADFSAETPLAQYADTNAILINNPGASSWVAHNKKTYPLIQAIEAQGVPLEQWDIVINYGIKTGFNEAFIIDGDTRKALIKEDPNSKAIIRPILRGEDVQAYMPTHADLWLLWVPWHFPLHEDNTISGVSSKAEKAFAAQYPTVFGHLLQHKKKLSARNKAETGIRYEWYALQRWGSNYHQDFAKPKIIYPNMTKYLPFAYDENTGFLCNDKAFILTGKHLKYLIILLNSILFKFAFKDRFPELLGDTREVRKVFVEKIPIRLPQNAAEEKAAGLLTDAIGFCKQQEAKAGHEERLWSNELIQWAEALVVEWYFATAVEAANAGVQTILLQHLPDISTLKTAAEKEAAIVKAVKKLSSAGSELAGLLQRMAALEPVRMMKEG